MFGNLLLPLLFLPAVFLVARVAAPLLPAGGAEHRALNAAVPRQVVLYVVAVLFERERGMLPVFGMLEILRQRGHFFLRFRIDSDQFDRLVDHLARRDFVVQKSLGRDGRRYRLNHVARRVPDIADPGVGVLDPA